ncbi:MAG: excinuclease ABC subunit UvrB [Planctomycetota bacterium]|nr:excinuclease ABC subunit UvrB [Planctomycetota bacterium]
MKGQESRPFEIISSFQPCGDQPGAIRELSRGIREKRPCQTLLGVTGSGKTFTVANVIAEMNRPTLLISHNKTLAAQLYSELREIFPNNAVEYFVSYYDYYQPEAYIPQRDLYIEKDASINNDIDRLRLSSTSSLLSRRDVIIVSSVSCIYGLGSPEEYSEMLVRIDRGGVLDRDDLLQRLVMIQYRRSDMELLRGTFRVRGDVVEILPAYEQTAYRVELFGDEVENIVEIDPLTGEILDDFDRITIYPAKHFVISEDKIQDAVTGIRAELDERLSQLESNGKLLEAQRLGSRTRYDCELLMEIGYCPGIENYSRHFTGLPPGQRPHNLLDYFPDDFLTIIDESHVTIPQIGGMYNGDRARKETLVKHGFRLPSALDNRPMRFDEWEQKTGQALFISATPANYELELCEGEVVELINRPTGLLDPLVEVRPAVGQVPDLTEEIRENIKAGNRTLVTTLTKRMSEDLHEHYQEIGIKSQYLHSEVETIERVEILQDLRRGRYDVLVGVNLLREGIDLPEVSMVAILDADKEGVLRSETALVQTIGRAARHVEARVILYADSVTGSMSRAMGETARRRKLQEEFNREHGIEPRSISKAILPGIEEEIRAHKIVRRVVGDDNETFQKRENLLQLEKEMLHAAENLEFERAAELRDSIDELKKKIADGGKMSAPRPGRPRTGNRIAKPDPDS